MRKICVVTGSRADYGLLYWLLKEIDKDKSLELQLIVTGMHLSPEFGNTYKIIEKDFQIVKKIKMNLIQDTPKNISMAMGYAQLAFAKVYEEIAPDLLVVLGDRYEILTATTTAMIANIPIVHIHGGEKTEGAVDEAIRHSISKMSHLHFCAANEYKNRIIQLGENPSRVFNVGALGLDNIKKLKLLSHKEFEESINFSLASKNLLVTYHPETLSKKSSQEQFKELLNALNKLENTNIIFTKTNSDTDGKIINTMIDEYVSQHPKNTISFISLGQLRYLSALKHVDAVIGNSSSGLLEVPSFKKATINIGNRQKGRIKASSVITCKCSEKSITKAIHKIYQKKFMQVLKKTKSPFGTAGACKRIKKVIKNINLENILQKSFYDIKFKDTL